MNKRSAHTFHIPVMGLGYTIDTPMKVARYGISSVISIMEDHLIEEMRRIHSHTFNREFIPISADDVDRRSKRISAYLNLMQVVVNDQIEKIKNEEFSIDSDLTKYYMLLPDESKSKRLYLKMLEIDDASLKSSLISNLKATVEAGSIDVNIMTKLDNKNETKSGDPLPDEFSDAKSALKGFAISNLSASVIFSAGMNPNLYTYCATFDGFFPDKNGRLQKRVILKVSDFRSALIQGKMLAKKGIWISEYRIESGLNCGGHAFATQGVLLGPILEEFKAKRETLYNEIFELCQVAIKEKNKLPFNEMPDLRITVQGGIGTSSENEFLMEYYNMDGTGWGSPFLLVPETTNVDDATLQALVQSKKEDFFISNASPLGVPFNNFKNCSSEKLRKYRIQKNRPGSPCYKKFLSSNIEFTEKPICTASRQYQHLKVQNIEQSDDSKEIKKAKILKVYEKECLCEGLGTSAILKNHGNLSHNLDAVSICPGPNLYYFKETYKLGEMIDHIYGRKNVHFKTNRPNVFINEAQLYIDYLKNEIESQLENLTLKQQDYYQKFKENIESGLDYYSNLFLTVKKDSKTFVDGALIHLDQLRENLHKINYLSFV